MSMANDLWFKDSGIQITPERERVYEAMEFMDEGLGPRAYRCLLQLADGIQPAANDIEWLTDGVEPEPIARMNGNRCVLTALGAALADAANRGDVVTMFGRTTLPRILGEQATP